MHEKENAYLQTENVCVGYEKQPLIRDICLQLRRGQILTLIGPNGAGKSTILKSITGQLSLLAGCVMIDETSMDTYSGNELAKKMSMVMTERVRTELMTCEDVVATGRYPYTGRFGILSEDDHRKVREAMLLVRIEELADRDYEKISDGQRQKVLLARALCQEPEIIVLDEPTSFLDIRHKVEILTILRRLVKEKNLAVVMSLHEIDLAQKVSDLVVCVNGDRIEKVGTPEEVFTSACINRLYGMESGSYHTGFGSLELEGVKGEPEVFVIGGGGSGISIYRKLQRQGIPFAAGVLHKHDADYEIAQTLSVEVIAEEAYEEISEAAVERAKRVLKSCKKLVVCQTIFGKMNEKNRKLITYAEAEGIEIVYPV